MWISTDWAKYVEEGDKLFEHMINNFEKFFADHSTIRSFGLRNADNCITTFYYEDFEPIFQKYALDMQKELITWIRKERQEGHLFKRENWNPFCDYEPCGCPADTYFGYRRMFLYKDFYCQLSIDTDCWKWRLEEDCDCDICKDDSPHFELAIWGWNNEEFQNERECNKFIMFPDNIIPDREWNVEKRIHPDPSPSPLITPKVKERMPPILIGDVIGSVCDFL